MISYGRQDISASDIEAVTEALYGDMITTGSYVDMFENELSQYVGSKTFVVNSGTAALHSAYFGAGVSSGDEIITPPNTFIATQAVAYSLGASIAYADIDIDTGLISIDSVEQLIGPKTKAIVVVDYAGQTCDLQEFRDLAEKHQLVLIEDAAHSLGTLYRSKPVGALADLTTFSFYPTKNITTGEGGAVASSSQALLDKAKTFSRQGLVRNSDQFILEPDGPWHQEVHEFGLNYRLTDFQCALGISQLKRISEFKTRRNEIFNHYINELGTLEQVSTIRQVPYCETMWHLFPILVDETIRKDLFMHLRSKGIGVQVNYFPAHLHPASERYSSRTWSCPNAEEFYRQEISLPIHTKLKDSDVDYVCETILDFFHT